MIGIILWTAITHATQLRNFELRHVAKQYNYAGNNGPTAAISTGASGEIQILIPYILARRAVHGSTSRYAHGSLPALNSPLS